MKQVWGMKMNSSLVILKLKFLWLIQGRCALRVMIQIWFKYYLLSVLNDYLLILYILII